MIEAIDKALETVVSSTIPTNVRNLILGKLTDVKRTVIEYRARGAQAVMESLSGYVGVLQTAGDTLEHNLKPEERLNLKDVVSIGNSILTPAKGATWLWPHVHELATSATSVILSVIK